MSQAFQREQNSGYLNGWASKEKEKTVRPARWRERATMTSDADDALFLLLPYPPSYLCQLAHPDLDRDLV